MGGREGHRAITQRFRWMEGGETWGSGSGNKRSHGEMQVDGQI
jgi:hypothetical protein